MYLYAYGLHIYGFNEKHNKSEYPSTRIVIIYYHELGMQTNE